MPLAIVIALFIAFIIMNIALATYGYRTGDMTGEVAMQNRADAREALALSSKQN